MFLTRKKTLLAQNMRWAVPTLQGCIPSYGSTYGAELRTQGTSTDLEAFYRSQATNSISITQAY